jgi:alkylation response protein AidB-like acyl-CoA dehydrogenase
VAVRQGDNWVINGAKRWIGLASVADICIVWAMTDEGVRGFIVETNTPGFTATPIDGKLSMRNSVQCDIELVNVYPAGAATKGGLGERMAEIGLMREAGCVYFTDADRAIVDSRVLMRALRYASSFGALIAHRPLDPWLVKGAAATGSSSGSCSAAR